MIKREWLGEMMFDLGIVIREKLRHSLEREKRLLKKMRCWNGYQATNLFLSHA